MSPMPRFRSVEFSTAVGSSITLTMPADVGVGDFYFACILSGKNEGLGIAGVSPVLKPGINQNDLATYSAWPLHETIPANFDTTPNEGVFTGAMGSPPLPGRVAEVTRWYDRMETPTGFHSLFDNQNWPVGQTTSIPGIPLATQDGDLLIAICRSWGTAGGDNASGSTPPSISPIAGGAWSLVRSDLSTWDWSTDEPLDPVDINFQHSYCLQNIYVRNATVSDVTTPTFNPTDTGFTVTPVTDSGPHGDHPPQATFGVEIICVPGGGVVDVHGANVSSGPATIHPPADIISVPALATAPSLTSSYTGSAVFEIISGIAPDGDDKSTTLPGDLFGHQPSPAPNYPLRVSWNKGDGYGSSFNGVIFQPPSFSVSNQNLIDGTTTPGVGQGRVAVTLVVTLNHPPPALDLFYPVGSGIAAGTEGGDTYTFSLDAALGDQPLIGFVACYKLVDNVNGPVSDSQGWGEGQPGTVLAAPSSWGGDDFTETWQEFLSFSPETLMVEVFGSLGVSNERPHSSDGSTERGGAIVHDATAGLYGGLTLSDQPVLASPTTMTGSLVTAAPWAGILLAILGTARQGGYIGRLVG